MTMLNLHKGKLYQMQEARDEFCSMLAKIESAGGGCHRFIFAEVEADSEEEGEQAALVAARWIFTETFLRQLLEIIPYYLALVENGASEPPTVEHGETVVPFPKKAMH